MADRGGSRFDAQKVGRLAAVTKTRRVEMQFTDSDHREHVVSLPLDAAVALGRLICDLSEGTPFLQDENNSGKPRKDS